MELTVVGAGPAYSDRAGSTGAAYLVRTARSAVLLDLGQGSFPRLAGLLDPADLDAVVISHLHPDHFIDLVPLRHYLRWEAPRRRVRVIAPAGLADRLDALHDEPGFAAEALDIEPLEPGILHDRGLRHRGRSGDSHGLELRIPRVRAGRPGRGSRNRLFR